MDRGSKYNRESIIQEVLEFESTWERVPTKQELIKLNEPARRLFGSWNKAIIAAGLMPNPVRFANKFIAKDGHICDSMAEKIVDDFLSARNVSHQIHVPYPWHNGMKSDFKVGDIWIEVFGLEGELPRYDELKRKKTELIKHYNLKLIAISLADVYRKGRLAHILALD